MRPRCGGGCDGTAGCLNSHFPGVDEAWSLHDPATGDIVQPYGTYETRAPAPVGQERPYRVELWPIGNRFDVEPKFSPDGRWVAFDRLRFPDGGFTQAAFVVSTKEPHRVHRLTPWRLNAEHPTWSPDSKWILFNTSPNGGIQAMRPNGEDRHVIRPATAGAGGHKPWFSPEGDRIVFMCENQGTLQEPPKDYNQDICVMDADGEDVEKPHRDRRRL